MTSAVETKAFYDLTTDMLDCVRDHDLSRLSRICDDDFGIVDINTAGGSQIIRNRTEWQAWFTSLFERLTEMQAETWSDIVNYESVVSGEMGYSVVDFDQMLVTPKQTLRFRVLATIIWKRVDGQWRESRYHSSLLSVVEV